MKFMRLWSVCLAILFLAAVLHAQGFMGRVADQTGAVGPKAKITVLNLATNIAIATAATDSSDYSVPYLKPGIYSVTASATGFDVEAKTDITF